jgi:hypothetical protein
MILSFAAPHYTPASPSKAISELPKAAFSPVKPVVSPKFIWVHVLYVFPDSPTLLTDSATVSSLRENERSEPAKIFSRRLPRGRR